MLPGYFIPIESQDENHVVQRSIYILMRVAMKNGNMPGMKTAFIDRAKTALVVIDLQKGVVGRQTAPHAANGVVKNAAAIAAAFRKNGMPVFLVRVAFSADGKDMLRPVVDAPWPTQTPPPDWTEIVPEMGPQTGDFVITKHQWGAFYGTELELALRRRGMTTIVLCGIATNIGVESTARFAFEYGFNQIFAEDAMAAMSAEEHALTVARIFPRIGLVRKTSEILEDLLPN
jgi:nicotinamidase-related amidase